MSRFNHTRTAISTLPISKIITGLTGYVDGIGMKAQTILEITFMHLRMHNTQMAKAEIIHVNC